MSRLAAFALVLLCLPSSGCLLLFAQPSCPGADPTSVGEVTFGDTTLTASTESLWLESDQAGTCLTKVTGSIEFERGCSLSFEAEGGATMEIFDATLWSEEGCGLEDGGWDLVDLGQSTVEPDGGVFSVPGRSDYCFDGTVTITLDLLFTNDDGAEVAAQGEVVTTGVDGADPESRPCG